MCTLSPASASIFNVYIIYRCLNFKNLISMRLLVVSRMRNICLATLQISVRFIKSKQYQLIFMFASCRPQDASGGDRLGRTRDGKAGTTGNDQASIKSKAKNLVTTMAGIYVKAVKCGILHFIEISFVR